MRGFLHDFGDILHKDSRRWIFIVNLQVILALVAVMREVVPRVRLSLLYLPIRGSQGPCPNTRRLHLE